MESLLTEINQIRQKIKKRAIDKSELQKPFAEAMYSFSMFMITFYSRVRLHLKIDYDSFIILQTVVSHSVYHLNKKKNRSASYEELETEWKETFKKHTNHIDSNIKLTISSICLVTGLPKETTRRKVNNLIKKNLLKNSRKEGIILGPMYKKVFQEFVPQTTLHLSKLLKTWDRKGIIKSALNFKI